MDSSPTDDPPIPPVPPAPEDCCGEGCVHCVLDRHDQAMERYQAALAAWHARHPGARRPEPS